MKTVIKVLHQIQKQKWFVVLSILLAAITVVLTLYAPILFGDAIDYLIFNRNSIKTILYDCAHWCTYMDHECYQ